MSNKVIHDMIEAIEHFAQVQSDFPVYDILGQVSRVVIRLIAAENGRAGSCRPVSGT